MLEELRKILSEHDWYCDDLYSKWQGYFIDHLLYSNRGIDEVLVVHLASLEKAIEEDKEIRHDR